jgi:hypothetical protein
MKYNMFHPLNQTCMDTGGGGDDSKFYVITKPHYYL